MNDLISRQAVLNLIRSLEFPNIERMKHYRLRYIDPNDVRELPPAQPEYEPVTAEDLAKTMSVTTAYSFMAWYGTALALMERQGFVICKKTT